MAELHRLSLFELPDDMLRVILEFCDLTTRCAVACTNAAALNSVLLGSVLLSMGGSDRFLKDAQFRQRISRRVITPSMNLHLQVAINADVVEVVKARRGRPKKHNHPPASTEIKEIRSIDDVCGV